MADRKKLAIIDGKSVFYRGYYAMSNLSTKDGTPTGGVYGFAVMALEVIKRLQPDYVCIAWDKPKTNIRRRLELYPEYKAGRKPPPPDFYDQIPMLHELLQAFGWPLYEFDDFEADDIMGTLAVQATAEDVDTLLITSDMDMLQLVNDHVKVFALKKGLSSIELYSPESFTAKYQIDVSQFLDLKALKGDSSDNIPGVPGVGEKTAIQLLLDHKTLDGVYENIELIKDSVKKKLIAGKESAYLSRQLADIWTTAPVTFNREELDGHTARPDEILNLFNRFEFRTLARQLPEIMQTDGARDQAVMKREGVKPMTLQAITSPETLQNLSAEKTVYVLADYTDASRREIKRLVFSLDNATGYQLTTEQLQDDAYRKALAGASFWQVETVSHDNKSLLKQLYAWQGDISDHFDVQVAGFVMNSLNRDQTMAGLAREFLNLEIEAEENQDALALQLTVLKKLHEYFSRELAKVKSLHDLFTDIEMPTIAVLARMEATGIELDTTYMKNFAKQVDASVKSLEKLIYEHAGQDFNIGSPGQLADILFEKLQLSSKNIKKGKTGYSTAASELDKLRQAHPIIDLISQYREVTKLKSTYVDTLPKLVDENSRLHTTFNLTTTQTGRLSSTDPNLQNIPVRTDLGRHIRTAFIAGEGNVLVSADYSQFELRLAAVMAEDTELVEMFNRGADIHQATAADVYERNIEDVTKQMRSAAKTINFGILYGMSPHGLMIATGMNRDQAIHFIDRYKQLRQPLFDYMDKTKQSARDKGYVETLFGRRRPMPDIKSSNFVVRQSAERAAINMPIQGTEADLMKLAMISVQKQLRDQHQNCNMLLQIHDSILVECPKDAAERVADILKNTMENIYKLPVRLDVDVSIGSNWGEL